MSNYSDNRLYAHELVALFVLKQRICASEVRFLLPPFGEQRSKDICTERDNKNRSLGS